MRLNPHAKFGPVDEQTDDDVLHLGRCREADRLAFSQSLGWRHQLLAHGVQGALNALGISRRQPHHYRLHPRVAVLL
jgi:hypothetical protein